MNNQNQLKKQAAEAALSYIPSGIILGVGTGSTVNCFIDALVKIKGRIDGAVASSKATEERLRKYGIPVLDLNSVGELSLYVDGADEFNIHRYLIKGGGGALTREKILASAAKKFVCIADETKKVDILGERFPLPIEVIPMARSLIARQLLAMNATPLYREGFITDNGNVILDVHHLQILNPVELEERLNNLPGIVTNGLFALRPADVVLCAGVERVREF